MDPVFVCIQRVSIHVKLDYTLIWAISMIIFLRLDEGVIAILKNTQNYHELLQTSKLFISFLIFVLQFYLLLTAHRLERLE